MNKVTCALMLALACATGCTHARPAASLAPSESLLSAAQLAARAGDSLRAQQYLLAALHAGADEAEVRPRLLRSYIADGQYRSAIECAREGLRLHADDHSLRLVLAQLYRATELETAAIAEYERLLEAAPDARTHFELGSLLYEAGRDAARADQHFRAYLTLAPEGAEAATARARLLKELP